MRESGLRVSLFTHRYLYLKSFDHSCRLDLFCWILYEVRAQSNVNNIWAKINNQLFFLSLITLFCVLLKLLLGSKKIAFCGKYKKNLNVLNKHFFRLEMTENVHVQFFPPVIYLYRNLSKYTHPEKYLKDVTTRHIKRHNDRFKRQCTFLSIYFLWTLVKWEIHTCPHICYKDI